jgi:nucleoside 2-deoxyribosyltransferase
MKIIRYEESLADIASSDVPTVFLAGPTVRGNQPHLTSWRPEACDIFHSLGFDGNIIIPEFTSRTESDRGKYWIPSWEFAGLIGCDAILFWVPRTRELIGLTTHHEKGYWLASKRNKIAYGRPPESYRNEYLDEMWKIDAVQRGIEPGVIFKTLEDTCKGAVQIAEASCNRYLTICHRVPWGGGDMGNRVESVVIVDSPYGAF